MGNTEINVNVPHISNQIEQTKKAISKLQIENPAIAIEGTSESMQKLAELYGRFSAALLLYNSKFFDDLEQAHKAVEEFQCQDQNQANNY